MEKNKNICYHYETQKYMEKTIYPNKGIMKKLVDIGCSSCSGKNYECNEYSSKNEFYSSRGCLK